MKHVLLPIIICLITTASFAQSSSVSGIVTSPDGSPIPGVNILESGTTNGTVSDIDGYYSLTISSPEASLTFSFIGYITSTIPVRRKSSIYHTMEEDIATLREVEVYATGYEKIPTERATGSFEQLNNQLINRSTSTDILSRLDGVTNGLWIDTRSLDIGSSNITSNASKQLRIRGLSTIHSENQPLIIVNNFPYEGDINSLNPNDVQSVTILKDAAAASIWGARAGNGVIVITTKSGKFNQPTQINIIGNTTIDQKPDLYSNPDFLVSSEFIALERQAFLLGHFTSQENSSSLPALTPVVETLIQQRDGLISEGEANRQQALLAQNDIRREVDKHFFQPAIRQQYAINITGGAQAFSHYTSLGYDKNAAFNSGSGSERFTLNNRNSFKLTPALTLENTLALTSGSTQQNGAGWGTSTTRLPYNRLLNEDGTFAAIPYGYRSSFIQEAQDQGLLDWQYRPLQEKKLNNNLSRSQEYRINSALNYEMLKNLNVNFRYQLQLVNTDRNRQQDKDSYYVRNLINQFTQADGSSPLPYGDILTQSNGKTVSHSGRLQATYTHQWNHNKLNLLVGMERRQTQQTSSTSQRYGYDPDILTYQNQLDYTTRYTIRPRGRAYIPTPSVDMEDLLDRFSSSYANISYTYKGKYTLTASARRDASNLFGVKTNQKSVPLWSSGVSWTITDEPFFNVAWIPYLRLRTTYGANGNINRNATSMTTIAYTSQSLFPLTTASITNPGNPQLRWEKVKTLNLAIDYACLGDRLSGSIEYFTKHSKDLLGRVPTDPTTGFPTNRSENAYTNYASTKTTGIDVEINTTNLSGALKWETSLLFNYNRTKLLKYYENQDNQQIGTYLQSSNGLREGQWLDQIYSIPWNGLSHETGEPIIYIEDQLSSDYTAYYNSLQYEDLIRSGSTVPPCTGAVRNTLTWKNLSLSFNITWKAGYYFRRSSFGYSQFFTSAISHQEAKHRWQHPGDEQYTDVPSMPATPNNQRDYVYQQSTATIEKGDHIRLKDINISYDIPLSTSKVRHAKIFVYTSNIDILWRANKKELDPDYPKASLIPAKSFALGINIGL